MVSIEADTSLFRASALAGMKKALAGVEGEIPVTADTAEARLQIEALKRRMAALGKQLAEVKIGANGKPAEAVIRKLQLELTELAKTVRSITLGGDTTKLDTAIAKEQAELVKLQAQASALVMDADEKKLAAKISQAEANLEKLNEEASSLALDADDKILLSKIADLRRQAFHLRAALGDPEAIILNVDKKAMQAKIESLEAQIAVLSDEMRHMVVDANFKALMDKIFAAEAELTVLKEQGDIPLIANAMALDAAIIALTAKIAAMKAEAADIKLGGDVNMAKLAGAEGRLLGMEATFRKVTTSTAALNTKLIQGGGAWGRFGLGALTARVALFGGLRFVAGWHVALDTVIESLAVIIPALVTAAAGLAAFGIAGADAARAVFHRLQNIHTVSDALNVTIGPMTGKLEALHAVVRPQVWQLYGDAIAIAHNKTDLFGKLAISTGGVIDRFAAKITVMATTSGTGLSNFLAAGKRDLAEFGRILASLGSAFGTLIRATQQTRIAEVLLNIVGAAAKLFDIFTKLSPPLLITAILLHGIYLWSGLAASAVVALLRPLSALAATAAGTKLAGTAMKDLAAAGGGTRFAIMGATFKDLGKNLKALPSRVTALAKSFGGLIAGNWPVVLGVVAVAALVGLVLWFRNAKDATDRFIDSANKMVTTATVLTVINRIGGALIATNAKLATANRQVAAAMNDSGRSGERVSRSWQNGVPAAAAAADAAQRLTGEHNKLVGQLDLVVPRLAGVAHSYGTKGLAGAMALAAVAGVKIDQLLSTDKAVWAGAAQQIDGVVQGYKNMGQGADQLGNDISLLTIVQSDQLKNVQTLNSAYDQFTKIVSGPVSGFISFANAVTRFGADAGVAGAQMGGLGGAAVAVSKKMTTASLQLSSDFQATYDSAVQMIDAMRLTGTAADQQIGAIKDVVQVMIPLAGHSKLAAAEISTLAQAAGMPATTSLKDLAKWAGKTKDPLSAAQKAADNAAISFYNMSLDAQKLGTALSQDLTKDMATAVENAVGLQGAMNTFAIDIQKTGTSIAKTATDRQTLLTDLAEIGITGAPAEAIIKSIADRLGGMKTPASVATVAFEKFGTQLHLTKDGADELWTKLKAQNLDTLAGKADTTKDKFIQLAEKGLNLNSTDATKLWKYLRLQYLDSLGGKADITKAKFEQLAKDGLGYSKDQADKLWLKLREQYLDTVGSKSDMTKGKFEKLAGQLGVTKTQADQLWTALQKVAAGSPYGARVNVTATGAGQITATGLPGTLSADSSLVFKAGGGAIGGHGGPKADDQLIAASTGEFMINAASAKKLGLPLLSKLNRYAGGGLVAPDPDRPERWAKWETGRYEADAATFFMKKVIAQFNKDVKAKNAAGPASAGGHVKWVANAGVQQWAATTKQALSMAGLSQNLVLDVLYQMMTESGGNPTAVNRTDCVPLSYMILTKRGWLRHDQVQPGDETIGFNPQTGRSEWTLITRVVHYDDAEVWRIGNSQWHADVTPNHRWWSERTAQRAVGRSTACPECGSVWPTMRGMETHLGKKHHVRLATVPAVNGAFVQTQDLIGADRLRLAAPADTEGIPSLSTEDAAIIGWIMGDGHAQKAYRQPVLTACPECGWLSGHRKPSRGPLKLEHMQNSIAVHRAKAHGIAGGGNDPSRETEDAGWDVSIYQSKPAQVIRIRAVLAHVPHTEGIRDRGHLPAHQFKLRRAYATDLMKRARQDELTPEEFVLALSPDQRAAWLAAMIDAEGHTEDGFTRIAQNDGPVADAIRLAVYLEGYRPTYSRFRREPRYKPGGTIGMARPHVAVSMFTRHEVLPRQSVFCVTTELGTWTTRGGDALSSSPFLTGNSNWIAGHPSVGLMRPGDASYPRDVCDVWCA